MVPESLSLGGAVDLHDEDLPARVIADRQQSPVAAQARMIGIGAAVPVQDARGAGLEKAGRPCRTGMDRPATDAGDAIRDEAAVPRVEECDSACTQGQVGGFSGGARIP